MPEMDYSKLLGRIKELGHTQKSVSEAIHISEGQFCQKLAGRYAFKQTDIQKLCEFLDIPANEIGDYFFHQRVEKTQPKRTAKLNWRKILSANDRRDDA